MKPVITDLEMLKSPNSWPRWPFLPLKRYVGEDRESGVFLEGEKKVYLTNIWRFDPNCDVLMYDSFEAILEDGWRVD